MADVYEIYREEFAARVLSGRPRSILEVGSGDGAFLRSVKGEVGRLAGLDPDRERVSALRADGYEAVQGAGEKLPFADGEFDVVVFSFAPHHFADWSVCLDEALRVARHSVEILDIWYDDTVADQRATHALDRWMKAIDRRGGMVHLDTLTPGEMLAPVLGRNDVTYDYICRRVASPTSIEEMTAYGRDHLKKADNDPELRRQLEELLAAGRRDGMSDEGAILMTIEKKR